MPGNAHNTHGIHRNGSRNLLARGQFAFCIIFLSSFILHPSSFAQTLQASAEPSEITPGSTTAYTITIVGGQPEEVPRLQLPASLIPTTDAPSHSNQVSVVNGVVSSSSSFTWIISARQAGTHVIPPQEILIGGKKFKSNEVRITVSTSAAQPASQNDPLLVMQIEKREIYVGEVVPVTATIYAPERRVAMQRIGLIEIPKDNFAIQRFPVQADQAIVSMGGARYRSYAFYSTLSALKPGKFKLGPATSEILFEVEARSAPGSMQHPFFTQMEQRTAKLQSSDIEMTVLPLPAEDRPPGFKGLVGDFEVAINAQPREVAVGDPVSVELTITGSGNFDSLSAPELASPGDWKLYPARRINMRQPNPTGETVEQRAIFNQVLIPKKLLSEIPPFEFSFFSPAKKQYVTVRTAPVPLRVNESGTSPFRNSPGSTVTTPGGRNDTEPDKTQQPQVKLTDIITLLPEQAAWISPRPELWKSRSFLFWNTVAAGSVILLLGIKFGTAFLQARAHSPSAPARELLKQLRGASMTRGVFYQNAAQYIHQREAAPNAECQAVLNQHEQLNFGPSRSAAEEPMPADERDRVLKIIQS